MRYHILEWNSLDDEIQMYDFESDKEISEVYEELELHNFSNVLIMEKKKVKKFFKAVASYKKYLKGIGSW